MPSYIRTRTEFAVNSFTAEGQVSPSVSTFADGGFVVTWVTGDPTQDGDNQAIKAQLFDSAGSKVGTEFLVNAVATGGQVSPSVTTFANGNFVVTWGTNTLADGTRVVEAQLFGRNGDRIGAEIQVTSGTSLFEPNVTSLADGRFMISWDDWTSQTVKGQIFSAAGARVGNVLTLATDPAQGFGDVIALANGGFVATWRINGTSWDVKAQVFSASGAKVGGGFIVNTTVAGSQNSPDGTALADGGFVITWAESNPEYSSGNTRIKAQMFTASGTKVGGELLVSTSSAYTMGGQVVTALPDGGFIIAWHNTNLITGGGSDSEVKAQRFSASGAKVDGEFQINTLTTGSQWLPDLDTLADGRVVAVWTSGSGDGSGSSVRAQILGTELAAPLPNTRPVIISDGGGTSATLTRDEGETAVTTVVASDDGEPTSLRYSITGGADAALFTINSITGALAFRQAPDHEAPADQGADNFYNVTVTASDGTLTGFQSIQIAIRHANHITIVSDGGYDYADVWVDENQTAVTVVSAIDEDGVPLTYTITGGYDAALFTIDPQTGELRFTVAPDYEEPVSMYGGNQYYVQVTASDGTRSDTQDIYVQVNDVEEPLGFAIVSDGGEDYAELHLPENSLAVTTLQVSGAEGPVTYEIVGGENADWFAIDPETGVLSFAWSPDFETGPDGGFGPPGYYDPYNYPASYDVIVRASDGVSSDEQEFIITVDDVDEAPVFESFYGAEHVDMIVTENDVDLGYVWAKDPDRYSWVTFGLDGPDSAFFQVDPYSGAFSFNAAPDFEAWADADGDNVYEVSVVAYSGMLSSVQSFSFTVVDMGEPVVITSNGGDDFVIVPVPENTTAVTTVQASGDGQVYYEIVGGTDASWFTIDPYSGALHFRNPANFETTAKEVGHGQQPHGTTYDVLVRASDAWTSDEQRLSVRVQDVDEAPAFLSYNGAASVAVTMFENASAVAAVNARDPDRNSVTTYAIAGADGALFKLDPASGALSFRQTPDFEAPADANRDNVYQVTVVASSGTLSATQAFSVTIRDVNENVTITSNGGGDSASVVLAENVPAVTTVAATGPGTVTYSIAGGADALYFTVNSATGALAFAHPSDFEGTGDADSNNVYEVVVRASNGLTSDDQHLSITLTDVDEDPDFFNHEPGVIQLWTSENAAYAGILNAYDVDGGPAITYAVTGGADGALFTIDPVTGDFSFRNAAGPDFEAPADSDGDNVYEVEVTAAAGTWSRARAFTVTVVDENEPIVITSNGGGTTAAVSTDEGRTIVTTVVGLDPDGTAPTYSIIGGADSARFTIDAATGVLSFAQAPDYEVPADQGADNFYTVTVAASDGQHQAWQTVQVLVGDVNEGVTITTGPALSVDENSGFVARIAATDGDGDPLGYAIVGGADASHFVIDPVTGDLTVKASLDFEAPADADGDNVYEVVVRASDGELSAQRQMSITVNDVYDSVEITSYGGAASVALTVQEGGVFQIADVDASLSPFQGTRFTISGGADAGRFTVDPISGQLSFKYPFNPDFEAPADSGGDNVYDVVVTASTGTSSDSQAFAITVADRNEGLWITSNDGGDASLSIDEGQRGVTTVTAFDMDGDVPTYSIAGGADAAAFAIDPVTGVLTFIAAPDYERPGDSDGNNVYRVIVAASDGEFTASQNLSITIGNVNEGVAITSNGGGASGTVAVGENRTAVTVVAATDADGGEVRYAISGGADSARFTIDAITGALAFVSAPNFETPGDAGGNNVYDVVVSATDGRFTATQALAVTVVNVDEAVTITSNGGGAGASVAMAENGTAVTTVAATDADGGAVTYAIAGGADASRFTIDAATGALAFVSAPNYEAPADADGNNVYDVIVSASDGSFSDTQAIAVTIGNVNEALAITSNGGGAAAAIAVAENGRAVAKVIAVDPDGTAPAYAIVGGADAARFTIDAQTGLLQFVAAPDWETPGDSDGDNVYAVVVQASDGSNVDQQALTVTVVNQRDGATVTGTTGGDSISGTSTNPALRTTNSEDNVSGRDGHDTILGLGGDDILAGDAGNDILNGGAGADRLTGGLGKDEFVYNAVGESTPGARDVITDFSRSQNDKISLSGIDANSQVTGNQAFAFIGAAAFSGVAGQLRFEQIGGNTFVSGDVNGDRVADFQIELTGAITPVASDFVL
jgi:hypothetical protein